MTPEDLRGIRQLFEQALERPVHGRAAFVEEVCPVALRQHLVELLAAHDQTCALDRGASPLLDGSGDRELPPRRFGPYVGIRLLGHGGMGSVYLAEREVGRARQRVAVKVIRPGTADVGSMLDRFRRDQEVLASLEHPNIARLLDIGKTESGLPYLVLEYIEGESIDVYCDRHKLGVAERLRLFRSVCEAVEAAHAKGIIHRDIKPSNLLVTEDGTVKLLDFGIARIVGTSELTLTHLTRTGPGTMTPEYASPEQMRGEETTEATDVYSLGVLLYILLTGRSPFGLQKRLVHELIRVVCDEPPVPPSAAATQEPDSPDAPVTSEQLSALRAERPNSLRRRLTGDLDSIVLKAMRKESNWRYPSAAAIAEDVGRHLEGHRVNAREENVRYKAERLWRRIVPPSDVALHHNWPVMIGAGIFGSIILIQNQLIDLGLKRGISGEPYLVWFLMYTFVIGVRERRRLAAGRYTPVDRQYTALIAVVVGLLQLITILNALTHTLPNAAIAFFWSLGVAICFLLSGLQASRLLAAGGAAVVLSIVAALLDPKFLYAWLAGGLVVGVCLPGALLGFRNPFTPDLGGDDGRLVTLHSGGRLTTE